MPRQTLRPRRPNEGNLRDQRSDIFKSSARAYRAAGFNLTDTDARNSVADTMASPKSPSPFLEGPGWTGTFTLPVCDIGEHNWSTAYGDTSPGDLGGCELNCTVMAASAKAAKMQGS